ncbi:MAG: hypothetical protein ABI151_08775 [Chitinophagaceae bacterium]
MRALVTIFVGLFIVYSLYLLSFTWFVNSHESAMAKRAMLAVKKLPTVDQKYPGNKDMQALYQDTLDQVYKTRYNRLLDSTKEKSITWWGTTYQKAKENELLLGLDLQGGINVTLDVELSGLIKNLANNPGDPNLKKALDEATRKKLSSNSDYITLFAQSFSQVNPGVSMGPLFANSTRNKLKIDASDNSVISYIREQSSAAMRQTYNVLTKRIDKFGVAQPNINLDETRGIITVELAGAEDPSRVRRFLQSTANLQFYELYTFNELGQSFEAADKALAIVLGGVKAADSTKKDSTKLAVAAKRDTGNISDILRADTVIKKADANTTAQNEHPLFSTVGFIGQRDDNKDGRPDYSPQIAYVRLQDTALVNSYLQNPAVKNNVPANVKQELSKMLSPFRLQSFLKKSTP